MFQGFNEATIKYWEEMECDNSRENFKGQQDLYQAGIKLPLEELYYDLLKYFEKLDCTFNLRKNCCISSPYNDARFCGDRPMKEYVYVRFRLLKSRKENVAGFFFDASREDFRYGINIYHMNAKGMGQIRGELLQDEEKSIDLINHITRKNLLEVSGDCLKRSYYPDREEPLKSWLDKRNIQFSHEEPISEIFFRRDLLEQMLTTFEESMELFRLLNRALR